MKLSKVIGALAAAIEKKKAWLVVQEEALKVSSFAEELAIQATIDYLKENIGELELILADLNKVKEL